MKGYLVQKKNESRRLRRIAWGRGLVVGSVSFGLIMMGTVPSMVVAINDGRVPATDVNTALGICIGLSLVLALLLALVTRITFAHRHRSEHP